MSINSNNSTTEQFVANIRFTHVKCQNVTYIFRSSVDVIYNYHYSTLNYSHISFSLRIVKCRHMVLHFDSAQTFNFWSRQVPDPTICSDAFEWNWFSHWADVLKWIVVDSWNSHHELRYFFFWKLKLNLTTIWEKQSMPHAARQQIQKLLMKKKTFSCIEDKNFEKMSIYETIVMIWIKRRHMNGIKKSVCRLRWEKEYLLELD